MRILIVEDDRLLGEGILAGLKQAGFGAEWVRDGLAGLAALHAEPFSAIVLDLGLPKLPGLLMLQQLRAERMAVPVLILTARDAAEDVIAGLDTGGDDYMIKPFDLGELAARLRALIRRTAGETAAVFEHGDLRLDPAARSVTWQGRHIELAPRAFDLLHELLLGAGRALTRAQLEAKLYPWGEEVESNAIEVHVHYLRKKLSPEFIRTVRGVGYLIPKR